MRFSDRTSQKDVMNRLTEAALRRAGAGPGLLDLTVSNPTTAGIPYATEAILGALARPEAMTYAPLAFGLASARAAVADDLRARGSAVDASRIALTASTSEAYAAVFKVLCDPGDEILVPQPSYPLLDFLATFDSVTLKPYPLVYAGGWHVDRDALRAAVGPRTRGIVVVSPNNPTGSYLGREELEAMLDLGLPIVSDEVFATYPLAGDAPPEGRIATVLGARRGLVLSLSGLSKLAALPQLKLGWIAADGDPSIVAAFLARLEIVLDAYLSVATPIQHALPAILGSRTTAEGAIRARTRANLATLRAALVAAPSATLLDVEAGWYAIVRVPEVHTDEEWAVRLVEEDSVHVQPGYFFDMHRGAHLVTSLLTPEATFAEGVARMVKRIAEDA
ncbi:MAG: pyridoxal phosphate-dependent aminotransferase [Deltaproteobacteria bacterium]|nr:pyridoxal phosphate-dependent aminotransferase [Deltaproteobacteria bacterium]